VLGYGFFCALLGALTFVVSSRLYKALAILALGASVMGVLAWLSRRAEKVGLETGQNTEPEAEPSDDGTRSTH